MWPSNVLIVMVLSIIRKTTDLWCYFKTTISNIVIK